MSVHLVVRVGEGELPGFVGNCAASGGSGCCCGCDVDDLARMEMNGFQGRKEFTEFSFSLEPCTHEKNVRVLRLW